MSELSGILSLLSFVGWAFIGVLAFEHYVSGLENRFRFQTIFYIAILTMIDLLLNIKILFQPDYSNPELVNMQWGIFVVTEMLYFHFTTYQSSLNRRQQLIITLAFLVAMATSIYGSFVAIEVIISSILLINALSSNSEVIRKYLGSAFAIYLFLSITYTGPNLANAMLAFAFTILFWLAVAKLYEEDHTKEALIDKQLHFLIEETEED